MERIWNFKLEQQKKKLRRLIISADDIRQAKEIALYILEHQLWDESAAVENKLVGHGLQTAMVVAYTRPFACQSTTHTLMLRPDIDLRSHLSDSELQIDQQLRSLRDQSLSHTDSDLQRLQLTMIGGDHPLTCAMTEAPSPLKSEAEYEAIVALLRKLQQLIAAEISKIQNQFASSEVI